jgi:hypothetical protein
MHNDNPFRAPARRAEARRTFHRPAHGMALKPVPATAASRLSGPMTGEQKLGEGSWELPLVGNAGVAKDPA